MRRLVFLCFSITYYHLAHIDDQLTGKVPKNLLSKGIMRAHLGR